MWKILASLQLARKEAEKVDFLFYSNVSDRCRNRVAYMCYVFGIESVFYHSSQQPNDPRRGEKFERHHA